MVSTDSNFSFTQPESASSDEVWEEIDERLWMTRLYKADHYHDDTMEVVCNWQNPIEDEDYEDHNVERLVMINSINGDMVKVTLLDLAKNDWEFDPSQMSPSDIFLDNVTSGLSHSFIVETEMTFNVLANQLSRPVLTIPDSICDKIEKLEGLKVGQNPKFAWNYLDDESDLWKDLEFFDVERLSRLAKASISD